MEIKYVVGQARDENGEIDLHMKRSREEEQQTYRDLMSLKGLKHGENHCEGKILEWLRAVGNGQDGGREGLVPL